MARSPFVPMEERVPEHGAGRGGGGGGAAKDRVVGQEEEVLLVHSQVRRIKQEDEEIREHLLKLQLLETRPLAARRGLRSLSPLRRAGSAAISVGE